MANALAKVMLWLVSWDKVRLQPTLKIVHDFIIFCYVLLNSLSFG